MTSIFQVKVYLAAMSICGILSAAAHQFNVISIEARYYAYMADYVGISTALYGINIGINACSAVLVPYQTHIFISAVVSSFGFVGAFYSLFAKTKLWQTIGRPMAFLPMTFVIAKPILYRLLLLFEGHGAVKRGAIFSSINWAQTHDFTNYGLVIHLSSLAVAVLSAFYYTSHFPERFVTGIFDIVGHSHQFFHILVFHAGVRQFHAILQDVHDRRSNLFGLEIGHFSVAIFLHVAVFLIVGFLAKRWIAKDVETRKTCFGKYYK